MSGNVAGNSASSMTTPTVVMLKVMVRGSSFSTTFWPMTVQTAKARHDATPYRTPTGESAMVPGMTPEMANMPASARMTAVAIFNVNRSLKTTVESRATTAG